jgi:hypothetical protein
MYLCCRAFIEPKLYLNVSGTAEEMFGVAISQAIKLKLVF